MPKFYTVAKFSSILCNIPTTSISFLIIIQAFLLYFLHARTLMSSATRPLAKWTEMVTLSYIYSETRKTKRLNLIPRYRSPPPPHRRGWKRRLRKTIANLQVTLQEAREDSSCAALNRLRAKLRELMKDGEKGDQQVSSAVEKSIESMVELSKSCDEFRRENERLLAEVETLK